MDALLAEDVEVDLAAPPAKGAEESHEPQIATFKYGDILVDAEI